MSLIFKHFRPSLARVARFSDAALQSLKIPLLVVLGAKDAMLDSAETLRRLERNAADLEIKWLPDAGHALLGQTAVIEEYLRRRLPKAGYRQLFITQGVYRVNIGYAERLYSYSAIGDQ